MFRCALICVLVGHLFLSALPAAAQTGCSLHGGFAQLGALIQDYAGTCTADEHYRPDQGLSTQQTTSGTFVWHSVDQSLSFSDGVHTWVLDPNGQVQVRGANERFAFEFNGDGFPLVGQTTSNADGPCPSQPVSVLAVENFYGNLIQQLGGQCVNVTVILSDPDADPHSFQPTAGDIRSFQTAALVMLNGLGYDDFADKAIIAQSRPPAAIRAADVLGLQVGANPHVWYSAGYVDQLKAAITARLKQVAPDASSYFDTQASAVDQSFGTYRQLIGQINAQFANAPVGATESIFVDLAYATGLQLVSPPEFMQAVAEGNDPSAQDIAAFQTQVKSKQLKVLVYNVQTVTPATERLKQLAREASIPIVGISETMPVGAQTFQGWQAEQLRLLLNALQKASA